MSYKEKELKKLYWTIGEIAGELNVTTSTLRHWHSKIPQSEPKKRYKNGQGRMYSLKERKFMHRIYDLIKIQGYRIEGAIRVLNEE